MIFVCGTVGVTRASVWQLENMAQNAGKNTYMNGIFMIYVSIWYIPQE